jgi:hypothetical protein
MTDEKNVRRYRVEKVPLKPGERPVLTHEPKPELPSPVLASRGDEFARINRRKKSIRTQILTTCRAIQNIADTFGDSPELQADRAELVALLDILDNGLPDDDKDDL